MILMFQGKFVKAIESGEKIHTIRLDKHRRWRSGLEIHFRTGSRYQGKTFYKNGLKCLSVQEIKFERWQIGHAAYIDGIRITDSMLNLLAFQDGFTSIEEMFNYFLPNKEEYSIWKGRLIHWTNFSYSRVKTEGIFRIGTFSKNGNRAYCLVIAKDRSYVKIENLPLLDFDFNHLCSVIDKVQKAIAKPILDLDNYPSTIPFNQLKLSFNENN